MKQWPTLSAFSQDDHQPKKPRRASSLKTDRGNLNDHEVEQLLTDWIDQRVLLAGFLTRILDHFLNDGSSFKVARVQEVVVTLPNKAKYDLSHSWIQRVEPFKDLPSGTKIRFSARVRNYVKKTGERAVGFSYPRDVAVIKPVAFCSAQATDPAPPRLAPPSPAPAPAAPSPLLVLLQTKDAVDRLGGVSAVSTFLESVSAFGGWEKVREIEGLASAGPKLCPSYSSFPPAAPWAMTCASSRAPYWLPGER
jgi:hypothetical protein